MITDFAWGCRNPRPTGRKLNAGSLGLYRMLSFDSQVNIINRLVGGQSHCAEW
jgi:hypothetical protein